MEDLIFDIQRFDEITNRTSDTVITGTANADNIYNSGSNVSINAGAGNDSIYNYSGSKVTINAGVGNDSIYNYSGDNVSINAGAGDDSIYNHSKYATIIGGDGNDSINNYYSSNALITGGKGDDSIYNTSGNYATITAGDGDDTIYNYNSSNVSINGGEGDDSIQMGYGSSNVTIEGGKGNDSIYGYSSSGSSVNVYVYNDGDGNDYITNVKSNDTLVIGGASYTTTKSGSNLIFNVGEGSITISGTTPIIQGTFGGVLPLNIDNNANKTLIAGTSEADTITNKGTKVTINAGKGDDTIKNIDSYGANVYLYKKGDGNDSITNFGANDTLIISGSDYVTSKSGSNLLVRVGEDVTTLVGAATITPIIQGTAADSTKAYATVNVQSDSRLTNYENQFLINGTESKDTIYNYGSQVTIEGGDHNDIINNGSYSNRPENVIIKGGEGYDSITNSGLNVTILGGDDNDTITNGALYSSKPANVAIYGGVGDDRIVNYGENATIDGGDGNDSINNYYSNATINGGSGDDTIRIATDGGIFSIKNNTIEGGKGNDYIYSGSYSYENVYVYNAGDGNDYISGFRANDTLVISGTSYSTTTSDKSIIVTAGKGTITLDGAASLSSFTIIETVGGGEDTTPADTTPADTTPADTTPSGDDDTVIAGVKLNNRKNSRFVTGTEYADTIKNTGTKITLFGYEDNDSITNTGSSVTVYGNEGNDTINSSGSNLFIDGGEDNDRISLSGSGTKNTISAGVGNDSIFSSNTSGVMYLYAKGDGNDYIKGWTAKDTLTITGGAFKTSTTNNDVIVSIAGGAKITLAGAKDKTININPSAASVGKSISNTVKAKNVTLATAYADTITNKGANATVYGYAGNDSVNNTAASVKVYVGEGADSIRNTGVNAYLDGGAGNDKITITSAAKNNTIIGGLGNDSIYSSVTSGVLYSYAKGDGNDYISGWTAKDTLTITGGAYKTSTTGSNVIVSVEGGAKITLAGAKGKTININNMVGKSISNTVKAKNVTLATAYADTIKNTGASATIYGYAGNDSVNNTAASVKVYGGDGNDSIRNTGVNAYLDGGAGNDKITITSAATKNTIVGGLGNDSIYSSVTSGVLYKYAKGDGNDYISGWTAKDTLTITGGAFTTSTTGSNVIVSITGGAKITLAGAKSKTININPSTASDTSNLVSSEILFEDDNFVTDTAQIDSVKELSDKNYSVGKVASLTGYDIFAQTESLVTAIYDKK